MVPSGAVMSACGSQAELLLLLLHPDLGAVRTLPLPLLVVDVALDLLHRDLALSTCHLYSSIAPPDLCRSQRIGRTGFRKPPPTPERWNQVGPLTNGSAGTRLVVTERGPKAKKEQNLDI